MRGLTPLFHPNVRQGARESFPGRGLRCNPVNFVLSELFGTFSLLCAVDKPCVMGLNSCGMLSSSLPPAVLSCFPLWPRPESDYELTATVSRVHRR